MVINGQNIKYQRNRVFGLFKFGKRDHMKEFVRSGLLYMNTLKHFRELESADLLRSDKHEGAIHCVQADGAILRVQHGDKWIDVGKLCGPVIGSDRSEENINVFCMFAFREKNSVFKVDPRNFEFGDTFVVLKDGNEFIRRVKELTARKGLKLEYNLVEYVDRSTYNGLIGKFRKFSDFSYQSEFRISIDSGKNRPYKLRIGDISDISIIGNLDELNERIKIEYSSSAKQSDSIRKLLVRILK